MNIILCNTCLLVNVWWLCTHWPLQRQRYDQTAGEAGWKSWL